MHLQGVFGLVCHGMPHARQTVSRSHRPSLLSTSSINRRTDTLLDANCQLRIFQSQPHSMIPCSCRRGFRRAQCLGLHIESLALQRVPVHSHETLTMEGLTGTHQTFNPLLDIAEPALAIGRGPLANNLAALVLHEGVTSQATNCLQFCA